MTLTAGLMVTLATLCASPVMAALPRQEPQQVTVLEGVAFGWNEQAPPMTERDGLVIRQQGQVIERRLALPAAPTNQRDAVRLVAIVEIEPVITTDRKSVV